MAPDRRKYWAGKWNDRLAPCQDFLLAATVLAALGLGIFFAFQSAGLFLPLPGAGGEGPRSVLAFDGDIRETEFPETRYRAPAEERDPTSGPNGTSSLPKIDWAARELRRQAASLLSLGEDYPGAVELLAAGDPDRAELLSTPAPRHRELLAALDEVLPLEAERLGRSREVVETGAGGGGEEEGAARRTARLRSLAEALPEGLLFSFVTNLHCALRDRTGASEAHLKLVLESCFPPHSRSRKLYRETRTLRPVPYPPAMPVSLPALDRAHEPQRP